MDQYVTGAMIKALREEKHLTQLELAEKLSVSDKTVSKWENGRGYPDITLLEPLSAALGVSMAELLAGRASRNTNRAANMLRSLFYVCPVCGNVLHACGRAAVSCCGIPLLPAEAEIPDEAHTMRIERIEDEWFVSMAHSMTKEHYISFFAAVSGDRVQIVRLYPEGAAETRFPMRGVRYILAYCNQDGLYRAAVPGRS